MSGSDERREAMRESRRALISRLNASEERLRELEERRREPDQPGRLTKEELALEIELERERNLSRRGFGQIV